MYVAAASIDAGLQALERAGHPVVALHLKDPNDLGAEFIRWEIATAAAGCVLGINPFDQPNVAGGRRTLPNGSSANGTRSSDPRDRRLRRVLRSEVGRRATTSRSPPTWSARARPRKLLERDPPRDSRPLQGGDHDRLRAAVPALDGAAPQGRADERRLHPGRGRRAIESDCRSPARRTRSAR